MIFGGSKISIAPRACRFVSYYQAMENAEGRVGPVGRVVYSLLLAVQPSHSACPAKGSERIPVTSS
jgi:hypothetical protein